MSTVYLGLLLHFYQPPGQVPGVLRRIVEESYRPLINVFGRYPNARASININGVLTEMLDEHGYGDVIAGLSGLAGSGQIEFTRSGKYHPILPLIEPSEAARQIALNDETNRRLFGTVYHPRGFFPPEMAWDHALAPLVAAADCSWVIMSGIACPVPWPLDRVYREAAGPRDLAVLFRDDLLSNKVSFRSTDAGGFLDDVRRLGDPASDRYVVIAMDAETYGHHIHGWEEEFLANLFTSLTAHAHGSESEPRPARRSRSTVAGTAIPAAIQVQLTTLSEIVDRIPAAPSLIPRSSSWSTTQEDIDSGNPFPLWRHRGNEIHRLLWRHLDQTMALLHMAERFAGPHSDHSLSTARTFADMALHSDQFWWASRRPHWSVNLIHRGLSMQRDVILNAMRAINLSDAPEEVRREAAERIAIARDLADRVTDRLFWD